MDSIIVGVVVVLALLYVANKAYKTLNSTGGCGCGCSDGKGKAKEHTSGCAGCTSHTAALGIKLKDVNQ